MWFGFFVLFYWDWVGFFFGLFLGKLRLLNNIRVVSGSGLMFVQVMTVYYYLHLAKDTTSDKRLNHHNQW